MDRLQADNCVGISRDPGISSLKLMVSWDRWKQFNNISPCDEGCTNAVSDKQNVYLGMSASPSERNSASNDTFTSHFAFKTH